MDETPIYNNLKAFFSFYSRRQKSKKNDARSRARVSTIKDFYGQPIKTHRLGGYLPNNLRKTYER
jgi:hypothetical protein